MTDTTNSDAEARTDFNGKMEHLSDLLELLSERLAASEQRRESRPTA